MGGFVLSIEGVEQAKRALEGLPRMLRKQALDQAYQEAGDVARAHIQDATPRATGALAASISRFRAEVGGEPVLDIRPSYKRGKGGRHAHFVEFGTQAHEIPRAQPKGKGGATAGPPPPPIEHPGARPHPFFGRGVTAATAPTLAVLEQHLGDAAKRYWAAQGGRA